MGDAVTMFMDWESGCAIDRNNELTIDSLLARIREQDEVIHQQQLAISSLKTTIEKHERLSESLFQPRNCDTQLIEGAFITQPPHNLQQSELLEKIRGLSEDIEDKDATINILIAKERSQTDIINSSHKALVRVLGKSIPDSCVGREIGVRYMGAIDELAWNCAYQKRYPGGLSCESDEIRYKWTDRVQNPGWSPLKVEEIGGMSGYCIHEDDHWVTELRQELGDELYKIVVDALIETETCNASGRTPVGVPWDFDSRKQLDFDEAIYHLGDCIEDLVDECKQHRYQSNWDR